MLYQHIPGSTSWGPLSIKLWYKVTPPLWTPPGCNALPLCQGSPGRQDSSLLHLTLTKYFLVYHSDPRVPQISLWTLLFLLNQLINSNSLINKHRGKCESSPQPYHAPHNFSNHKWDITTLMQYLPKTCLNKREEVSFWLPSGTKIEVRSRKTVHLPAFNYYNETPETSYLWRKQKVMP